MANKTFTIGKLMATRGVADKKNDCPEFERFSRQAFSRYRRCDWGDLTESDKRQNDEAVRNVLTEACYERIPFSVCC